MMANEEMETLEVTDTSPGQVDVQPMYSDDEIDVIEGDDAQVSDGEKALLAELAQKKEELLGLKGQADSAQALRQAVGELGQTLQPKQTINPGFGAPAQVDWNAEMAKFDETVWQTPGKSTADFVSKLIGAQAVQQANAILGLSKRIVRTDPELAPIMQKYEGEVDAYVAAQPPQVRASDPDIYEKAAKFVRAQHVDDIVAQKVAEALAQQGIGKAQTAQRPASFTEAGRPASPASPAKKQVQITRSQGAMVRNFAASQGVTEDVAYRYLKNNGQI